MTRPSLIKNEAGIALVTAILVLMLASGLMAGLFAALIADQRSHATDRDQSVAYAAAHAGLEKLTASLAGLFAVDFSPSSTQVLALDDIPPAITGFSYRIPGGAAGSGYQVAFTPDPVAGPNFGNPLAFPNTDITTGPFEGFKGLITPYVITVTAVSTTGNSEVRLRRELQTVAVPVFQFGIFGEKSLGFHAGPDFDFGGRVHTNESLFLAQQTGNTLTFRDKITAVTQVVRNKLSNGRPTEDTTHDGHVLIPPVIGGTYPSSYRDLLKTESSGTTTTPCIALATTDSRCYTTWNTLSSTTYKATIRTEATGAKRLTLPLASQGATPIDLIKRPVAGEDVARPLVLQQRYYSLASLRILLSDRAADLTSLPGSVAATAPHEITVAGAIAGYAPGAGKPPVALSPGPEPTATIGGVAGTSTIKVSAVTATGEMEISTWNGAAWVVGIPQGAFVGSLNLLNGVTKVVAALPVNVPCRTFTGTTLTGCSATHGTIATGTVLTFNYTGGFGLPDGSFTATTTGSSTGTNVINFTAALPLAMRFRATRHMYVGEDPVVCTGYKDNNTDGTIDRLTGCTTTAGTIDTSGSSIVVANDPIYTGATTTTGTSLLGGFIKIEKQNSTGVWSDVTEELLNLGFAGPNMEGDPCPDPTPNAVIRLMRLRDNGYTSDLCADGLATAYHQSVAPALWSATDFVPNNLFDAREGSTRTEATNQGIKMAGLFSYVAFDANNFKRWVNGDLGGTGAQVLNNNGYIIYFSDRRGDHDETNADAETGEYGNEDSINPGLAAEAKSNALEAGENFNESVNGAGVATMQTYGETPWNNVANIPAGTVVGLGFESTQTPRSVLALKYTARGRLARPVLFRRALKVFNGGIASGVNKLPTAGLTVTAENPIYVQGNWNATADDVEAEPNVPTALIADAITLLSNAFKDTKTFTFPFDASNRDASSTGYRFAMVTGKAIPFPNPAWANAAGGWLREFGSDGGVHNFMKMLENWGGQNLKYRGSMVSLYYSRQATGIYRNDANIYSPPTRGYNFDSDFLSPPLLPPGTPMFRDINTLKFRQILRPNQ